MKRAAHDKHILRRNRLGACILKYIKPGTGIHMNLVNTEDARGPVFSGNGVLMFKYIKHVGHLPRTNEQLGRMRAIWEHATMASVGIQYTDTAIFEWADWLIATNMKYDLSMDHDDLYSQFLAGFPSSFDVVITPMRLAPALVFPNRYPEWHPRAGDAHADAGEPSIELAATALYPEWSRCEGKEIKSIPKGLIDHAHPATARTIENEPNSGGVDESNSEGVDTLEPDTHNTNNDDDYDDAKHQLAMTRHPYNLCYPLGEKRVESKPRPKSRSKPCPKSTLLTTH